MRVLGRRDSAGPHCQFGRHLARDGSPGGDVGLDLEWPHVGLVVGKRGAGKSHTLGVIAEGILEAGGVGGVVLDPMGGLTGLAEHPEARVTHEPEIDPAVLEPPAWCSLFGVEPDSDVGSLLWRATAARDTLDEMDGWLRNHGEGASRRASINHIELARSWGIFAAGTDLDDELHAETVTVINLAGLAQAPTAAITRAVADRLYTTAVDQDGLALPWLIIDEAHVFFDGAAAPGLHRLLTRGRQPGVSVIAATQRPGALPSVAISQADLLIAHRLTAAEDVAALAEARQTYHHQGLADRLPAEQGRALVVDDSSESVHTVAVRDRHTPHRGQTPRATERAQ